jgi:cephalosporin hydroxylase
MITRDDVAKELYRHVLKGPAPRNKYPRWRGVNVIKLPTDLVLYAQAILENTPDYIIETGTKFGGSALFFADMLELTGKGMVISIDYNPSRQPDHPRIHYITGRSTSTEVLEQVRCIVGDGGSVMGSLDSNHTRRHVKRELYYYSPFITKGQYLVVEDCYASVSTKAGPGEAVDWFLPRTKEFIHIDVTEQFIVGVTRGGWLLKL